MSLNCWSSRERRGDRVPGSAIISVKKDNKEPYLAGLDLEHKD